MCALSATLVRTVFGRPDHCRTPLPVHQELSVHTFSWVRVHTWQVWYVTCCMHALASYTHIHIHMHAYMHAYMHTHMHTCIHTCIPCNVMHTCIHSFRRQTCKHSAHRSYIDTHTHTHACMHVCMYARMHVCMYACMHARIQCVSAIHTYAHAAYIHTRWNYTHIRRRSPILLNVPLPHILEI